MSLAKIKKSFRLPPDVVQKIEESGNESLLVEQAVKQFNPKNETKPVEIPKPEIPIQKIEVIWK